MGSGRNLRKLVCALALLLSAQVGAIRLGITAAEADYDSGVAAYQVGDFRGAYEAWQPLAQEGDATAQNSLGALYDHGLGVPEDHVKAAYWYEKAAKQNLPLAMRNLGTLYANGHGVPLDVEQAKFWLQKAADAGDEQAGSRLAALTRSVPPPPAASSSESSTNFSSDTPQQNAVAPAQPEVGDSSETTSQPAESSGPPPSGVTGTSDSLTEVPSAIPTTESPSIDSSTTTPEVAPESTTTESATPELTTTEPAPSGTDTALIDPAPAPPPETLASTGLPKSTQPQPDSAKGKMKPEAPASATPELAEAPTPTPAPDATTSTTDATMPTSPTTEAMTTKTEPLELAPAEQTETTEATPPAAETPMETPAAEASAPATAEAAATTVPAATAPAETPAPVTTPAAIEPAPSTAPVQTAAVVAPAPALENWLLGEWQGPTQGCPPGGGVEFKATESIVYYKGKINATLPVAYRVDPGSVTVSTVGPDGITQDYVYQRTGTNSMIIVGIPPTMPRSLLGAAHRRCGAAPVSTPTQQATMTAPIAVYPESTPPVTDNQTPPKASSYSGAAAPIAGAPAAVPMAPDLPKTTTPAAAPEPEAELVQEPEAAPAPEPEAAPSAASNPIVPELKPAETTETASTEPAATDAPAPEESLAPEATAEPTEPALPKSTMPASVADKAKKAEEEKAAAAAAAASTQTQTEAEPPEAEPATPEPTTSEPTTSEPATPEAEVDPSTTEMASSEPAPETEPAPESVPAPEPAPEPVPSAEPEPSTETTTETSPTPEPLPLEPEPTQEAAAAPAPAPDLTTQEELGQEAFDAGDVEKALQIWEPLAKSGNTGVAVNVGGMYEFGQKPMPQDYAKAVEWYLFAAEHGDPYAQYKVGRAYTRGTGVPIDRVQAYKWLTVGMQSLSNAEDGKTGKASHMELETALNDIIGAMSQEEVTRASQLVKQYNEQHKIDG
jgi:TPR repeat protein